MITYSFTDIGSDSLYIHLYKCIKNDILQDILHAGEKLPSKRSLAKNLNISVITIENAYAQLIAEGYVYSIPKKGFFVADIKSLHKKEEPILSTENVQLSSGKSNYLADFTSNQTSSEHFPFSIWAKLTRELLTHNQSELLTNPPCGGILPLRESIAKHLKDFRNMTVSPEQIIIGAGTEYLYGLLIQLLGFDKHYAVEDPGYSKISQIYESHCILCDFVSMDSFGVNIADLEKQNIDIIHISPSHHFPTGTVMPISRRYELLGWAAKSDMRYIIEDDYDSEYRVSGQPIPTLQSIDIQEKVIYMNTFTKTLASTIRISYMVLPPALLDRYRALLGFYACPVPAFEQYTLATFLAEGHFATHLRRMRTFYRARRDAVIETLRRAPFAERITVREADAGLHFLVEIDTPLPDEELRLLFQKAAIRVAFLQDYRIDGNRPDTHTAVLNYSGLEPRDLRVGLERLAASLQS